MECGTRLDHVGALREVLVTFDIQYDPSDQQFLSNNSQWTMKKSSFSSV